MSATGVTKEISPSWKDLIFWRTAVWKSIQKEFSKGIETVPPKDKIFRPFVHTKLADVKVMFIFPEPYNRRDVADGLALSYNRTSNNPTYETAPLYFKALIDECKRDKDIKVKRGDLKRWAKQGVLLWNGRLTTAPSRGNGHAGLGWNVLTREVLETVYLSNPKTVFVFFDTEKSYRFILPDDAVTLSCPLPTAATEERIFWGSGIFSEINKRLKEGGISPVSWKI